jgi:hypothetical protein
MNNWIVVLVLCFSGCSSEGPMSASEPQLPATVVSAPAAEPEPIADPPAGAPAPVEDPPAFRCVRSDQSTDVGKPTHVRVIGGHDPVVWAVIDLMGLPHIGEGRDALVTWPQPMIAQVEFTAGKQYGVQRNVETITCRVTVH